MRFLVMLIFLFCFDRMVPFAMRTYGVGTLPWADRAEVTAFNKRYGWIAWPRTLFLFIAAAAIGAKDFIADRNEIALFVGVAAMVLWGVFLIRDVFRAGRKPF